MRGSIKGNAHTLIDRRYRRIQCKCIFQSVSWVVFDFFRTGRYAARVVEPAKKLKFSTIIIAAIAGLVGFGVFLFIGALIASFAAGPLHVSPMEGGRGVFAMLIGIIVGVIGLVCSVCLVLILCVFVWL